MTQTAADLQQLKGVGTVLAKRLYDAGLDSFTKIAQEGEEGLKRVRGIPPRSIASILSQVKTLSVAPHADKGERAEAMKHRLIEVKELLHTLAETTRQRFQDELAGKPGKKLAADLVRIEDALERVRDGGKKVSKRAVSALGKAQKRVEGLEDASCKKVRKGLKRAKKAVLKAL